MIRALGPGDASAGFRSGVHALDDFLARHAAPNELAGICRTYIRARTGDDGDELPSVLGFYTLSMADVEADAIAAVLATRLPRYPMPVALIGRLAVDERVRGRRIGEALLVDALRRVHVASAALGCVGVIVDPKGPDAEAFYLRYGFVSLGGESWPRRLFMSIAVLADAVAE